MGDAMGSYWKSWDMSGLANLTGKVAVITGGASGIGRGMAERMLAAGMKVVIADVEEARLEQTASEIGALGVKTDVRSYEQVEALAKAAVDAYGAVHVVCNNAGVGPMGLIADLVMADWRWMLDVNLFGVIHGVQAFLPILKANTDGGHIVNTASIGAFFTAPRTGAYTVAKFGVMALTETLAQELAAEGSKVGASILCPGPVKTSISTSSRNRPADAGVGRLYDVRSEDLGVFDGDVPYISPEETGGLVIDSIKRGDLYIFTHPEMALWTKYRNDAIEKAAMDAISRQSKI